MVPQDWSGNTGSDDHVLGLLCRRRQPDPCKCTVCTRVGPWKEMITSPNGVYARLLGKDGMFQKIFWTVLLSRCLPSKGHHLLFLNRRFPNDCLL